MKRIAVALACLLMVAALAASCGANSRLLRDNPLVRAAFYPPEVGPVPGLGPDTDGDAFDHSLYARILAEVVQPDGLVRYGAVRARERELAQYLDQLAKADLEALSRHARLALLLNAYNAFTLKLVAENPGLRSIRDIPSGQRWKAERWNLAGNTVSLDELEHEIIRPGFGEPRIHFALVCAATGCPPLRKEPYAGAGLVAQLDDQTRRFLADPRNLRWDPQRKTLHLSELLDWFRSDFGGDESDVVAFVRRYVDPGLAAQLEEAGVELRVRYLQYDWSLNGAWNGE